MKNVEVTVSSGLHQCQKHGVANATFMTHLTNNEVYESDISNVHWPHFQCHLTNIT